jgi:hypothetical protein
MQSILPTMFQPLTSVESKMYLYTPSINELIPREKVKTKFYYSLKGQSTTNFLKHFYFLHLVTLLLPYGKMENN